MRWPIGSVAQVPEDEWRDVASGVVAGNAAGDSTKALAPEGDPSPNAARTTPNTAVATLREPTQRETLRIIILPLALLMASASVAAKEDFVADVGEPGSALRTRVMFPFRVMTYAVSEWRSWRRPVRNRPESRRRPRCAAALSRVPVK